jgi:hypothetical protein
MGTTRDIIKRAMKDGNFRERLMKDPKSAIEQEFGVQFPKGVRVQVHENSPDVINLVVPGPLVAEDRSLSQAELDQVSGGMAARTTTKLKDTFGQCPIQW